MPRISKATEYNWKKLNSDTEAKLTKRANKTRSERCVTATAYLNDPAALRLLDAAVRACAPVEQVMYTLVVSCLTAAGIIGKEHVRRFLAGYEKWAGASVDVPVGVWNTGEDVLGFIYQSLTAEGRRNLTGLYYTSRKIVEHMLDGKQLAEGETFLDPCCGSGAFLTGVRTADPSGLYGFDTDPVAVMLATANLLVKYSSVEFTPNVFCTDFLAPPAVGGKCIPRYFDNIYTNPPWGSDRDGMYAGRYPQIKSKEKASMVVAEALRRIGSDGTLCFLLPTSLLKIKTHADLRRLLLSQTDVRQIDLFTGRFDGVFTDYFSIRMKPGAGGTAGYVVRREGKCSRVKLSDGDRRSGHIVTEPLSGQDLAIINRVETRRHGDLTNSLWALGIVTGDNKNKVKTEPGEGLEPVYAGRHVVPFGFTDSRSYISFAPDEFQQCAREEYFRAPEKLVYRFIARYPVVAYDDGRRLCLNSANILIPSIEGLSVKSVAALLNSSLYRYLYVLRFHDIKVLKSNLASLPFPHLTPEADASLSRLTDDIRTSAFTSVMQRRLDDAVYSLFGIPAAGRRHIGLRLAEAGLRNYF